MSPSRLRYVRAGGPRRSDRVKARLSAAADSGWRTGRGLTSRVADLWASSLQFRVVVLTVFLCLAVMMFLLSFIYQRIADGLIEARTASAQQDALYNANDLQQQLDRTDKRQPEDIRQFTYDLLWRQETRGGDQARQLVLTRAVDAPAGATPTLFTGVDPAVIPPELRAALQADPRHQQSQVVSIDYSGRSVPALVVGSRVALPQLGQHELYYIYPMAREQETLDMLRRTFVLGGILFVLLIGLVVYLVTRLAVDPIREAAVVAGRISSGRLNERMHVRGADDLAKLAMAFNGMADHLQEQIRQLEDLSRVQQRFVSDVSHELRTPLTTIRMAAELIHDGRASFEPAVARSAELLLAELDRFEALLADLLEISRFDAGAAVLDREDTDLRVVAQRVLDSCATLAQSTGTPLALLGADAPRVAEMDARRVERIVRNLVVNAIEHGEGRPIVVELGSSETAVAVAVRDHGVGLRPGEAELVFHRFWRADPARTRTTGGTGLGLAISMEDARLHDGWLHAWGEPGRGSRFRLTLPKVAGRPIGYPPLSLIDAPPPVVGTSVELTSSMSVPSASPTAAPQGSVAPTVAAASEPTPPLAVGVAEGGRTVQRGSPPSGEETDGPLHSDADDGR